MNARGADVYLRPAGEHGLILISGLQDEGLERMKREGLAPAATIEVSPGRYEAWVKLSDKAVPESVLRVAQVGLAKRYGGDLDVDPTKRTLRSGGWRA
jgi:hypothetical protein